MIRKIASLALAAGVFASFAGAQSPVGKWKFASIQANIPADQLEKVKARMSSTTLSMSSDHTFTMVAGAQTITGSWMASGHQVTLKPARVGGKTIAEVKAQIEQMVAKNPQLAQNPQVAAQITHVTDPLKATLSADGKSIVLAASAGRQGTVTFHKA